MLPFLVHIESLDQSVSNSRPTSIAEKICSVNNIKIS